MRHSGGTNHNGRRLGFRYLSLTPRHDGHTRRGRSTLGCQAVAMNAWEQVVVALDAEGVPAVIDVMVDPTEYDPGFEKFHRLR